MSSEVLARTGRHRQLYENGFRLVAGCIPYKLEPIVEDAENSAVDLIRRLKVLMISSPNRQDLVFPKGGWENDETVGEAACREALEEAGVRGNLHETKLGEWIFKSKSRQNTCSNEGACKGYMFALEVKEELEFWPEQSSHHRKWVNVTDALRLSRYPWMREALAACIKFLSQKLELPIDNSMELAIDASEPSTMRWLYQSHRSTTLLQSSPAKAGLGPKPPKRWLWARTLAYFFTYMSKGLFLC